MGSLREWWGRSEEDADGRHYLTCATLDEGPGKGAGLAIEARGQPWKLDLQREALRLATCERRAILLWDGTNYRPRTCGCGGKLCPVCARARAARATTRWRAVLEAAAASGATLRHLTLTQPAASAPGGLITDREVRRGWTGTVARASDTEWTCAPPCAGEGLLGSYRRFRGALRELRSNRATRGLWRDGLGGYLVGIEWTGRGPGGVPRWHTHAHVLTTHPAGDTPPPGEALCASWARHVDGSARAQHVREVDPGAVVEVLKYPFKPAHLTSAQRIEVLAVARGLHAHHLGGGWHPRPGGIPEPFRTWLEARPEPPGWKVLWWLEPSEAPTGPIPHQYSGQVRDGEHLWSHHPDGSEPFVARAEPFARALDLPVDSYPEPGDDELDTVFDED